MFELSRCVNVCCLTILPLPVLFAACVHVYFLLPWLERWEVGG